MRVALYARVSTTDQHCEQQLHELRDYVRARSWRVEGEYVDHGVSGKTGSRPAMNRLMKAARQRAIDAVVCWKLDRWGRSMPHLVQSVQELKAIGVRFVAVSQGIDTDESNPMAKLMLHLLSAFAEFEHDLIVERTKAGLLKARREGRFGGRPRAVVNRLKIVEMDNEGYSMREIADEVGVSAATVCRILAVARHRQQTAQAVL
jgi:DNA invertase Pin-like site-specific DNA recombinase